MRRIVNQVKPISLQDDIFLANSRPSQPMSPNERSWNCCERFGSQSLDLSWERAELGEIYLRLICWAMGVWHVRATGATGLNCDTARGGTLGTPKMPGYRDVISNGPFSIATADTDKRGMEGRIHNSAPFPFVQVMTLGNVIYWAKQGCEEIHGLGFILPPWNGLKF